MKKIIILTNNPRVYLEYHKNYKVNFVEKSYMDVLILARDFVHKGYELLTHPLSGSVKPNETPYKTVIISDVSKGIKVDSLMIIENSILTTKNFIKIKPTPQWPDNILDDFKEIDYRLVQAGMESMKR